MCRAPARAAAALGLGTPDRLPPRRGGSLLRLGCALPGTTVDCSCSARLGSRIALLPIPRPRRAGEWCCSSSPPPSPTSSFPCAARGGCCSPPPHSVTPTPRAVGVDGVSRPGWVWVGGPSLASSAAARSAPVLWRGGADRGARAAPPGFPSGAVD
ncbi:hypothetical protein BDA96_10G010200 [Sorghum bicolor]|uniref:Uncharacterized protein n=1 Tax=Sorghum bicolor TaxID=4558 RepID=A0A921Q0S1_SORBI|nr:hypothetical protein BDA96_10G010200 [Sorghum bicolor]